MAKYIKLVSGLPVTEDETFYDASIYVTTEIGIPGTGYSSDHTIFTLPNSQTYDGTTNELEVWCNEARWEPGIHFSYQLSTSATTITTLTAIPNESRIRFRKIIFS